MKVFISYSRSEPNSKLAKEYLTRALKDSVVSTWGVPLTRPGVPLAEAVRQAARDADYIVVLVGPDGELSKFQQLEWQAALEAVWANPKKRLIPVLVGDAKIPTFVRSTVPPGQGIEIVRIENPHRDLNKILKRLVTALETGKGLDDLTERVDTTLEDRARQKERLAYLKRAAKAFK